MSKSWPLIMLSVFLCSLACSHAGRFPPGSRPNILLIVMDAARADHLSCYGYQRNTTPSLDRLASEGLRFTQAVSSTSWTLPSHASLFTGLLPNEHGAHHQHRWLAGHIPTLAELLKTRGYRTAGFSDNPWVDSSRNLHRGFDIFRAVWADSAVAEPRKYHSTEYINTLACEFITRCRAEDETFFVFINYMDVHAPYDPPEPYRSLYLDPGEQVSQLADSANCNQKLLQDGKLTLSAKDFDSLRDLYDGALNYLDGRIGELLDCLRSAGLYDSTLVIVTSDHGELFGEWGHLGHDKMLYRPLVHIPLLLRHPAIIGTPAVREEPVAITDIFHTLVGLLSIGGAAPTGAPRRNLLAERIGRYPCYSLKKTHPFDDNASLGWYRNDCRALWTPGGRHYIMFEGESYECYDLARDSGERENLCPVSVTEEEVAERIKEFEEGLQQFRETRDDLLADRRQRVHPESEKVLHALGYIGDTDERTAVSDSLGEPPHVMEHFFRGLFFARRDSLKEAERQWRIAMGMSPRNPKIRFELGKVLLRQGKNQEALRAFRSLHGIIETGREADERYVYSARAYLGEFYYRSGRLEEAAGQYEQLLLMRPDDERALHMLGRISQLSKKNERAKYYYSRLLELEPGHLAALINLGLLEQGEGNYLKAEEYYLQALEVDSTDLSANYNIAKLFAETGRPRSAEKHYSRVLRRNPDDSLTHLALALLYRQDPSRREQALEHFRAAARLLPDQAESLEQRYIRPLRQELARENRETQAGTRE